ncbi:MAG: hypothetical protein AB9M53_05855 [Leptothrix sp. (in: b-proteobacteria)]
MALSEILSLFSFGITTKDIKEAINWLKKNSTPYLNYNVELILKTYAKTPNILKSPKSFNSIKTPYVIEYDFRDRAVPNSLGIVNCIGFYEYPPELLPHRKAMVSIFAKEGRLKKGNLPCPRVKDFYITDSGELGLDIEQAAYYDQVGSNLTLDYPLQDRPQGVPDPCSTVREWDLHNSKGTMLLPKLQASRLANTIGVAVGITATDKFGQRQILKRKRGNKVAVYANQWHVPFSFAQEWDNRLVIGQSISLSEFIFRDYGHELAEELPGLATADFEPPRLLAFCRDLVRGGKPQFFIELHSNIPMEDLRSRIHSDDFAEYEDETGTVGSTQSGMSPELLAFSVLVGTTKFGAT